MQAYNHVSSYFYDRVAVVPDDYTYETIMGALVLVVSVAMIIICIMTMAYFYKHRRDQVIRKSSPTFCQLILLGIVAVNVGVIVTALPASSAGCIISYWLVILGFALIIANLLAKTYRIFRIFRHVRLSSTAITDKDLFKFSGCLIFIEVILLLLLTFGDGTLHVDVVYSAVDPLYSYYDCRTNSQSFQSGILLALAALNFAIVFFIAALAYFTRHVQDAFNESRYIGITVYIYTLLCIILVPLYLTTSSGYNYALWLVLERTLGIVLAMFATLAALFLPKFITIRRNNRRQRMLYGKASRNSRIVTDLSLSRMSEPRFMTGFLWNAPPTGRRSIGGTDPSSNRHAST